MPQQHPIHLDHIAVHAGDRELSAQFLAAVLGLDVGAPYGPFLPVELGNGVTLDFYATPDEVEIQPQHYAFLVAEEAFDGAISRLERLGVTYYADPHLNEPGRINRLFGGRGAYFEDPSGHNIEIMTRPYSR